MGACAGSAAAREIDVYKRQVQLGKEQHQTCQALLTGLMLLFSELHSEYPDNIEVMEA